MLETMYVRCTHCGYDNSPEYRFCGMCGASLAHPPVVAAPPPKESPRQPVTETAGNGNGAATADVEPVHGPSFLGLAEDPKTEFHYLYEDEPPRSHAGLVAVLILVLGVGGFLYWQWRNNGFPFNRLNASNAPAQSASPSEAAPAQTQDQQTHTDKPMTGAGDVLPTDSNSKPPDTGKTTEFPAQGGQTQPGTPPATGKESNATEGNEKSPPEKPAEKPAEEANATPPPSVPERRAARKPTPRTLAAKPAPKPAPETPDAKTAPDADLELAGERYLYGTGLPQNCSKAESSLRTAAMHGNSKAETVLGTMYATGHCVGRDLPTAYRWFARALHQDPQNARISTDLQVLWRQMSQQERQLATTNAQ